MDICVNNVTPKVNIGVADVHSGVDSCVNSISMEFDFSITSVTTEFDLGVNVLLFSVDTSVTRGNIKVKISFFKCHFRK